MAGSRRRNVGKLSVGFHMVQFARRPTAAAADKELKHFYCHLFTSRGAACWCDVMRWDNEEKVLPFAEPDSCVWTLFCPVYVGYAAQVMNGSLSRCSVAATAHSLVFQFSRREVQKKYFLSWGYLLIIVTHFISRFLILLAEENGESHHRQSTN